MPTFPTADPVASLGVPDPSAVKQARVGAVDDRRGVPVIPPPARLPLVAATTLCAATVVLLAVRYAGVEGPSGLDTQLGRYVVDGLAEHRGALRWAVALLGPPTVLVSAVLVSLFAWRRRSRRLAVIALIAPLLTGAITSVLQPVIGRTLHGGDALPSGHTAGVTAVATVAALVAAGTVGRARRWVGPVAVAAVPAVGGGMAAALVANGLHVPTDTVAGFCTGVAVVLGLAMAVDGVAALGESRVRRPGN